MVGKLARWLRILGIDVVYESSLDDHELVALARSEKRVLLTRDHPLASSSDVPPRLLIVSEDFREQLRQVVKTYNLDPTEAVFTRCMDCNSVLEPLSPENARDQVPPYVFSTQTRFKRCPRCDKVLWGGTHRDQMQRMLDSIFGS